MQIVGEVPHPECKITLLKWNNRYLVKLEKGPFEQTYKVSQFNVANDEELRQVVNTDFITNALRQFDVMEVIWSNAMQRL
ncbi:MAG: hypothetical protein ACK4RF_02830 [Cyclobacteriaceae bacterium]